MISISSFKTEIEDSHTEAVTYEFLQEFMRDKFSRNVGPINLFFRGSATPSSIERVDENTGLLFLDAAVLNLQTDDGRGDTDFEVEQYDLLILSKGEGWGFDEKEDRPIYYYRFELNQNKKETRMEATAP